MVDDTHILHHGPGAVTVPVSELNGIEHRHVVVVPDHGRIGVELERSRTPANQAIVVEFDLDIRRGRQSAPTSTGSWRPPSC